MLHVYVDRTDAGVPFYVGMGDDARLRRVGRNRHHDNVARKHGLVRTVVGSHEDREAAARHETELTAELHTFVDDPLNEGLGCNYTRGGEGCACSEETRRKTSETIRAGYAAGRVPWSKGRKGTYTVNISDADRERRRRQLTELNRDRSRPRKHHTEEARAKMRKPHRCSTCGETGHKKTTCIKNRPAPPENR